MKIILFILLLSCSLYSQSPYYSIQFSVKDTDGSEVTSITQKVCHFEYTPVIPSGDYWFGKDTSQLNWSNLPDSMYSKLKCGSESMVNSSEFKDANQYMVWENIYKFTVINSNGDTMTIVFPVLVKSFVTHIVLGKIIFQKGYFELINNLRYTYKENLLIDVPENYTWEKTEFNNRKIKIN